MEGYKPYNNALTPHEQERLKKMYHADGTEFLLIPIWADQSKLTTEYRKAYRT